MRRKIWSDHEVQDAGREPEAGPSPSADRMEELLAMIGGGEGGGAPCSVGVPPWFLSAAHDRLGEMTRGTEHAGTVETAFGNASGIAPDKVALALAAIDETFRAEVRAMGAFKA
jgi:hypothetical protein